MSKGCFFILLILSVCCLSLTTDFKELDLKLFKITIPKEWTYKPEQGEDSFAGMIKTENAYLQFDFSRMGYADNLITPEEEYLEDEDWLGECAFCKPGVTYTYPSNIENEKRALMKEKGITDSSLVKVEVDPNYETKKVISKPTIKYIRKFPKADYIAKLTYRGVTIILPITIPTKIKTEHIKIDSNSTYIIKTIWPIIPGKGITGIYIKKRSSSFNFNMIGTDLSEQEQNSALKAFKTIVIK